MFVRIWEDQIGTAVRPFVVIVMSVRWIRFSGGVCRRKVDYCRVRTGINNADIES